MHVSIYAVKSVKIAVLLCFSTFLLAGCFTVNNLLGGKKSTAPASTGTPSNYSPKANVSQFGVDSAKLKGTYSGIYHCGNTTTQFVLQFKDTGGGSISGNVLRTNLQYDMRGRQQKTMTTDTAFKGSYDAKSAILAFRVDNPDRRNSYQHRQMTAWLYGVMLPDASGFVLFDRAPISSKCSMWIAKRGNRFPDEWEFLENEANPKRSAGFFSRRTLSKEQQADHQRKKCDPELAAWLRHAEKVDMRRRGRHFHTVRMMYSDKYFVPHFGKPFHEIDYDDRQIIGIRLGGSCMRDQEIMRLGTGTAQHMALSFQQHSNVTDVDKGISNIGFNMLFAWLEQAKQHFNHMAKNEGEPADVKIMLKSLDTVFLLLFPVDKNTFIRYANSQYKNMIIPRLRKDLQTELAATQTSLSDLNQLASFDQRSSRRFPEVDRTELAQLMDQVKQNVNQHAVSAAQTFAQERQGIQGIAHIDTWQDTFKNTVVLLNTSNQQQLDNIFIARRLVIADQLLESEKQRFQKQVKQLRASPSAVKASAGYEKHFAKTYARVLNMPDYVAFKQQRQQARNELLADSVLAMTKLINTQPHERTLKEFELAYLIESDRQLAAGKNIHAILEKHRKQVAPFQSGGNFKIYLNALYTYDSETLTQLDWVSAKPVADSVKQLEQPMLGLGAILEGVSGGVIPGRKIMKAGFAGVEEASLIYPIMAFYILNYEQYNGVCVEPGAHKRTVQYRWVETTKRGHFEYISDSGGHDTHYRINERFLPIFNVIYRSDGNNVVAKFADRFFKGQGKIYRDELINGTYNLMQANCKSKIIKQMEDNMIRYFNVAKRRLDKAKRRAWQ